MANGKKSWKEKLDSGNEPHVGTMKRSISGVPAGGLMLIPTPRQVDKYIRLIEKGTCKAPQEMAAELAKEAGADITCPLCVGIFVRIASEAAHEELIEGKKPEEVTPFWRIIPPKAKVRQKLTFGDAIVDQLRREEGLPV
jgi:hypothetical protein